MFTYSQMSKESYTKQLSLAQVQFKWSTQFKSENTSISNHSVEYNTQVSSIYPINRTLSGATTPSQSGPGSDGNEEVFRIPQSSSITGTSASDCLVTYPGHS